MTRLIRKLMLLIIIAAVLVLGLSAYVTQSVKSEIAGVDTGGGISETEAADCKSIDPQCILVLGCAVWANDEPSPMLRDRLVEYSEPDCMLKYILAKGVPPEDIFLDYAGFSTYESVYRSHAVFMADRMIVVTQKYHLFRALKACKALGIKAKGVASNQQKYSGRYYREAREVLARDKDFFKGMIKAKPTFLGDEIPVDGDGTVTHLN